MLKATRPGWSVAVGFVIRSAAAMAIPPNACDPACVRRFGYAYEFFAGTFANVNPTPGVSWFGYDEFTIQTWMKPYSLLPGTKQGLIGAHYMNDGTTQQHSNAGLCIIGHDLFFLTGTRFDRKPLNYTLGVQRWVHVTATFSISDAGGTGKLYINGNLHASASNMGRVTYVYLPFLIGKAYQQEYTPFSGQLDEIRAFNRALSRTDVEESWNKQLHGNEVGLYFYFNADGDPDGIMVDRSTAGRTTALTKNTEAESFNSRNYVRVDCEGCFPDADGKSCVPMDNSTWGTCGDGLVLGTEECDGGDGCSANCTCFDGWESHSLPYCTLRASASDCNWDDALNSCLLAPHSTCTESVNVIACLFNLGCNVVNGPLIAGAALFDCLSHCSGDSVNTCNSILPEYCQRFGTRATCEARNCSWCSSGCTTIESDCQEYCGNGLTRGCEQCDDGDTVTGDGCSSNCTIERGWSCSLALCVPICGDGVVVGWEICDDGNVSNGCLDNCTLRTGWQFNGTGTSPICGDGLIHGWEACDDGNTLNGDGCNSACTVDEGWLCYGLPSECQRKAAKAWIFGLTLGPLSTALLILAAVIAIRSRKRRNAHRTDGNLQSSEFIKMSVLDSVPVFDESASKFVAVSEFPLLISSCNVDFGTKESKHIEVDEEAVSSVQITNRSDSAVRWSANPVNVAKYTLTFEPSAGKLSSGDSAVVSARLVVHCTTHLVVNAPLCIPGSETTEARHTWLRIIAEVNPSTKLDPDEIKFIRPPIGEGSFGTVFRGVYRTQDVAVKMLKYQNRGVQMDVLLREIRMMESLRSPFIVQFVGGVVFPGSLCLVTEFAPHGNLSSLLIDRRMPYALKLRMCLDCAKGMLYLHSCKIMHRDLDNVLVVSLNVADPVVCKLTDFGSTREVGESDAAKMTSFIGTPIYMAPEVLDTSQFYAMPADVYSFGILMHEVITEKTPFANFHFSKPWEIAHHILQGGRMPIPRYCPDSYGKLMCKCWDQEPKKRPLFLQVVASLESMARQDERSSSSGSAMSSSSTSLSSSESVESQEEEATASTSAMTLTMGSRTTAEGALVATGSDTITTTKHTDAGPKQSSQTAID